jgi:FkbM family methyltransferase
MCLMSANDLASSALLWYTEHVPWHRGKSKVVHAVKDAFSLHVAGDREVTRLGLRWVLNPSDHSEGYLFWVGTCDIWERYHMGRLLSKDSVMFDVGTNFGLYALTLADQGPGATIHCFEPNPITYARLTRNISLNPMRNLRPHQLGLGDWEGTASVVNNNDTNSGAASLAEGKGALITTLDLFCEKNQIQRIDVMKVDVEGFEARLLKGGLRSIAQFRPTMQFELNPPALARGGSSVDEVLGLLKSLGYEFYELERDRVVKMGPPPEGTDYLINCFCVHSQNQPAGLLISD